MGDYVYRFRLVPENEGAVRFENGRPVYYIRPNPKYLPSAMRFAHAAIHDYIVATCRVRKPFIHDEFLVSGDLLDGVSRGR